ncbi:MAG: hypothetical protein EBZ07_02900 [Verrucomicrobia bacterium]|nr:hypothetical protein [Verrucomicrobiota bacterium]
MKQGRAVEPGESLQLLVDPMCNLFAGLVLLSVFLALFAGRNQGAPTKESAESGRFANQELLQKRSAETRDAITEIRAANETLASRLGTGAVLPPLEAVEKAVAEADEATRGEAVISCKTLQQALESELENLQGELVSLTNEAEGLKKETARLQERQEKLSRQKAAGTDGNQEVTLRIPRARPTDKTPVYLLLSGGKVFPAQLPSGLEDDAHVERQRSPSEDRIFPKSGRGLSTGKDTEKYLKLIPADRCYPVLVVYPDSFAQYAEVRRTLEKFKLGFGWEPRESGAPLRLSARGFKPEAQ